MAVTDVVQFHGVVVSFDEIFVFDIKPILINFLAEKSDKLDTKGKNDIESEHKCSFGTLKLNVGEGLNNSEEDVNCACVSPPFVQCVKSK